MTLPGLAPMIYPSVGRRPARSFSLPGERRRFAYRTWDITTLLSFRGRFESYQLRRISRSCPLAGRIMVFVGVFEAHEFNFGLPVGGHGFCWPGWGTGQRAHP